MSTLYAALSEEDLVFQRLKAFHLERVEQITRELPVKDDSPGMIVLHLIPQSSADGRTRFEGKDLRKHGSGLGPLGADGSSSLNRFNAAGWLMPDGRRERRAYTQLFRDGRLEAAMAGACYKQQHQFCVVNDRRCEQAILTILPNYFAFCKAAELSPPVWMFSSLVGFDGARFISNPHFSDYSEHAIEAKLVTLPEIVIDPLDADVAQLLRPWCDAFWQAGGMAQSLNYDKDGVRKLREGR